MFTVFESLKEDQALEVVCRGIYRYVSIQPAPTAWPSIEGFVIFEVYYNPDTQKPAPPDPLDVVCIYTYKGDQPSLTGSIGASVSIAVVVYPATSNAHMLH